MTTTRPGMLVLADDIAHGTVAPNGNQYGTDCSATVSGLPAAISTQQWQNWSSPPFPLQDARFYEYGDHGPGSAAASDVPQLTAAQARDYTVASYLGGWRPHI